jgi:hypothetical protein
MRGRGAGVDVEVTLEVEIGPVVSSFGLLLLLELLDEVLACPGDVGGGVRATSALISTVAVMLAKEPVSSEVGSCVLDCGSLQQVGRRVSVVISSGCVCRLF